VNKERATTEYIHEMVRLRNPKTQSSPTFGLHRISFSRYLFRAFWITFLYAKPTNALYHILKYSHIAATCFGIPHAIIREIHWVPYGE
jgi:hypothetical protein